MLIDIIKEMVNRSQREEFIKIFCIEYPNMIQLIREDDSWRWNFPLKIDSGNNIDIAERVWKELEKGKVILGKDKEYNPSEPESGGCIGIYSGYDESRKYYYLFVRLYIKDHCFKLDRAIPFDEHCTIKLLEKVFGYESISD